MSKASQNTPANQAAEASTTAQNLARAAFNTCELTHAAFAEKYGLSVGTFRDWLYGIGKPDKATTTYLKLIVAEPVIVAALVAKLKQ